MLCHYEDGEDEDESPKQQRKLMTLAIKMLREHFDRCKHERHKHYHEFMRVIVYNQMYDKEISIFTLEVP